MFLIMDNTYRYFIVVEDFRDRQKGNLMIEAEDLQDLYSKFTSIYENFLIVNILGKEKI